MRARRAVSHFAVGSAALSLAALADRAEGEFLQTSATSELGRGARNGARVQCNVVKAHNGAGKTVH